MKEVLIRIESYSTSWLWWMETRVIDFYHKFAKKYKFTFLSNRDLSTIWLNNLVFINYNNIFGIICDIFTIKKFDIIESNGHRDNIISTINYIIFYLYYKYKRTKLLIVIHWIQGLEKNSWWKKIVYDSILMIGFLVCTKIISVSKETEKYIFEHYKLLQKSLKRKSVIIPNYISVKKWRKLSIWKPLKAIIISRLDKEKSNWINKAIDFCKEYNISIEIYGWGENIWVLRKLHPNIIFHWEILNSNIPIWKYDIIFWMWRSLLEWISVNLIWILLWYDNIICIVEEYNLPKLSFTNFSWRWIQSEEYQSIYFNIIQNIDTKKYLKTATLLREKYSINNLNDYWSI